MKTLLSLLTAILLANIGFALNQHLVDSFITKLKVLEAEKKELRHNDASRYDATVSKILYCHSVAY